MNLAIHPIRTEADYKAALARVDTLMNAEPGTPDGDHLDVLVTLIEAYEARHWPIPSPDPIEAIRVRMEQRGLHPRDLEPMIGSRGRVSEVLSRKRQLTLPMIRRLAKELDLPADVLIQESQEIPARGRDAA
ncbi:MAG TPA: transcriptional regulator [Longimicrobium sp.]|jgi:HTH-type transcriptional regulator/antitoxin HigA|uniref:helix-turn-helix domain-containing protein n=1 Tax=Longimicrobium sp. TaxID=2029185 RepID=UPI002ED9495C